MISGTLRMPAATSGGVKLNIATPAYKGEYCSAYVRSLYALLSAAPALGLRFSFAVHPLARPISKTSAERSPIFDGGKHRLKSFTRLCSAVEH